MEHKGTQRLETERLILRRFAVEDAAAMYQNWASDPEVVKYLTWPVHSSAEATRALLENWVQRYENPDVYNWGIEWKESGELIGSISVVQIRERISEASLGWCIGKTWWGQGVMPEAGNAVLDYLFRTVGFHRVAATHDVENPKSGRVMQKIGMKYEGTLRSAGVNNRGICDVVCYAILSEDFL